MALNWVNISTSALTHNVRVFQGVLGGDVRLSIVVKANAYGHGLAECARVFEEAGVDQLCVDSVDEARQLRQAGRHLPILILGHIPLSDLAEVVDLNCEIVVYNLETIEQLAALKKPVKIHLKIETGTHRQGIALNDLRGFAERIQQAGTIEVVGISTHFANLEDRLNHDYALKQLAVFNEAVGVLKRAGIRPLVRHCASTAAALILPEAHLDMVRLGIGAYGLWPSQKTQKATKRLGLGIELQPALSWKTVVAQVKPVKKGDLVGYGCAHSMSHDGRIAVLPVGYYDGYVRKLGGRAHVLIAGQKAPVIGRICMNMCMVDVTHLPDVRPEDEVVLLGRQGAEEITAEDLAEWSETINYEVTTRIREGLPRTLC